MAVASTGHGCASVGRDAVALSRVGVGCGTHDWVVADVDCARSAGTARVIHRSPGAQLVGREASGLCVLWRKGGAPHFLVLSGEESRLYGTSFGGSTRRLNDARPSVSPVRVWIDQDLCTGDGLCVDHCHDVFVQLEDGIAYVVEDGKVLNDPGGGGSLARVVERDVQSVVRAAEVCPGECIFIELDEGESWSSVLEGDSIPQPS